jgi:ribosome-associated protein
MPASDGQQLATEAARIASDDKSEDVVVLDLRGRSNVADYFVIATGSSDRQMAAVADHIEDYARKLGQKPFGGKRLDSDVWILLDYVDVVVHLFDRDRRQYYDLELLWGDAPKIEWQRSIPA